MSDLPPELVSDPDQAEASGEDWEAGLLRWARRQLDSGADKILDTALPAFERTMIEAALEKTGGRKKEAAELLGWGRNTLTRKLKELGMPGAGEH